ncbi:MAG: thymidine phosphorylase [Fimbriimonadaceae bacterium]|nr:thymidine phosphorylase [Fimbriimonadaceae bacterium]
MDFTEIIAKRRDGLLHSPDELNVLAQGAATGTVPDYQLSAWLMAAYLNPLSEEETTELTVAMANSGERVDLTGLLKPWVDKHSTGGVGDKTTIVLLPLLAACGLTVVKMSGRGLGITGGTVDKLSSIPGFRMDLTPSELKAQAAEIGVAITGQSPDLAPADKVLYALRDVTGTVTSMPLIVSSILSKKIAGGSETVVIDVKCGSGAFMKTLQEAQELATWLKRIGERAGLHVRCAITDMDQPLGYAVGNALEVKEAIRVLKGVESGRFQTLCLELAGLTLCACGKAASQEEGKAMALNALIHGEALDKAKVWFAAQGGDMSVFETEDWELAQHVVEVRAEQEGWVEKIDAQMIGQAVVDLGGGRKTKSDEIDPSVGIVLKVEVGSKVGKGDVLAEVHARLSQADEARSVQEAILISEAEVAARPLILGQV